MFCGFRRWTGLAQARTMGICKLVSRAQAELVLAAAAAAGQRSQHFTEKHTWNLLLHQGPR